MHAISQAELQEVMNVSAIAPFMVVQTLLPLLANSTYPFVLNVHAREGLFTVFKTDNHVHTNMAKAAFAMLTKCLPYVHLGPQDEARTAQRRLQGKKIKHKLRVHGCDPGWISLDEYGKDGCIWTYPPLDERDGAARILYPLWAKLDACWQTRRHFTQLTV